MSDPKSRQLFERAARVIPGGVNSPVRAFRAVGGTPVFVSRAEGAYLFGADGRRYIDYVGSWGPMILGHAHPAVVGAVRDAAGRGTSYGAPTELEVRFAEKLCALYPSIEMVRAVSSGTEATMAALRAARGFTGREAIVKFEGSYHGHADYLLVKAGSGAATLGVPDSAGVPAASAASTVTLAYNAERGLRAVFATRGGEIAPVIVAPAGSNTGVEPPAPGWGGGGGGGGVGRGGGIGDHPLLRAGPRGFVDRREGLRPRRLRSLARRDALGGRLLAPVAVRGRVHRRGARRGRHRPRDRG